MHKLVAWYVVELERRLHGKVPAERLDQLVAEVQSHLEESSEALRAEGVEEPEMAAIHRFGSVRTFAFHVLCGSVSPSTRRFWGWIGFLAVVGMCNLALAPAFLADYTSTIWILVLGVLFCTGLFGFAGWRSKRRHFVQALAGALLGSVCLTGVLSANFVGLGFGQGYLLRSELDEQEHRWQDDQITLSGFKSQLERAQKFYQPEAFDAVSRLAFASEFRGSRGSFVAPVLLHRQDDGRYELVSAQYGTYSESRFEFLQRGKVALGQVRADLIRLQDSLAAVPEARKKPWTSELPSFAPQAMAWSGLCLAVLWALALIVGAIGKAIHVRPRRFVA